MRNRVERLINRLKQFRRIATRYEKRAVNYLANAGAGLFSSLMSASGTGSGTRAGARTAQADRAGGSGGGGSKWFAMDDFEDEIQLARRYQAQAQRRALPGAGSGKTSSETRRSRTLME